MTHEYTLLVGGTILRGPGQPPVSAIAWAAGTVIAIGTDDEIRGISRGDSEVLDLLGAFAVPIEPDVEVAWSPSVVLEIGCPADLAVLRTDPRRARARPRPIAVIRGGHVVEGGLPVGARNQSQRTAHPTCSRR